MSSNWPQLTVALALTLGAAYLVADVRRAPSPIRFLRSVIEDHEIEAAFVDRPRRIVRGVVFLVTAVALAFSRDDARRPSDAVRRQTRKR